MRAKFALCLANAIGVGSLEVAAFARTNRGPRGAVVRMMSEDDSLEAQFAAERARRERSERDAAFRPSSESDDASEPFIGIKEIRLDSAGRPYAATPRPVAPPSTTSQVRDRFSGTGLAIGGLFSLGAIGLLLAIAAADGAA